MMVFSVGIIDSIHVPQREGEREREREREREGERGRERLGIYRALHKSVRNDPIQFGRAKSA